MSEEVELLAWWELLASNLLVALSRHPAVSQLLASMMSALASTTAPSGQMYDAILQATLSHATSVAAIELDTLIGDAAELL